MISVSIHAAIAQTAALTITSPANGTVVSPGQVITVTVTRSQSSGITRVALNDGDWTPLMEGSDPLIFSITVPPAAQAGPFQITAFDFTPRGPVGLGTASAPLVLMVKGPVVTSLGANFRSMHLRFAGVTSQLRLIGYSSPGTPVSLQNPSAVSYSSQVSSVASVDQSGLVTALGPGQTTIIAIYTNPNGSKVAVNVPVFVAKSIPGDLNGDGKVDLEDEAILQGAINTTAVGPNDARDLNHDGKINALDARILVTLCTYPRCATHH